LIPEYRDLPEEDIITTVEKAFEAILFLVSDNDYKGISLFLDDLIQKRNRVGIGLQQIRRVVMIFKDVLVSRILFNDQHDDKINQELLGFVDNLSIEVEERLSAIYYRKCDKDKNSMAIYKATMDSLAVPVLLLRNDDFTITYANRAMINLAGPLEGYDFFAILKTRGFALEYESIEAEMLTCGSCKPRNFTHKGNQHQLFVTAVTYEDMDKNYSVVTIAGTLQ
jgi:PAS domain-containing protein